MDPLNDRLLDELDGALLVGLAAAARVFYDALLAENFPGDHAIVLVESWQRSWLEAVRNGRIEPQRGSGPATN